MWHSQVCVVVLTIGIIINHVKSNSMSVNRKQNIFYIALLLICCLLTSTNVRGENIDSILNVLDKEILRQSEYTAIKERRIDSLKSIMRSTRDLRRNYELCGILFEEYKKYQYDSTYVYATRQLQLAEQLADREAVAHAKCNLIFSYATVGFYLEAWQVLSGFSTEGLSTGMLQEYYGRCVLFYQNLGFYAHGIGPLVEQYDVKRHEALSKELEMAKINCDTLSQRLSWVGMKDLSPDMTIKKRLETLSAYKISDIDLAVQYYVISETLERKGDVDAAIYYQALAAILDIRSNNHETLAANTLALKMCERGDIERAVRYIHLAQSDADFYNARMRKMQINSALQYIEGVRYNKVKEQRILFFAIISVVIITLLFLTVLFLGLKRKNKVLHSAQREIENKVRELDRANVELSAVNAKLKEANEIKDSYVIQSLYSDSEFVNNVEDKCKTMARKIKAKQFGDLAGLLRDIGVKQERERLSSAFDSTFLKLFPNFIDEYNKLFPEEFKVAVGADGTLPTEVRIFALMRLGIKDSVIVANYLNLSLNTVYVYKAKVKSRAVVQKEDFDACIMRIQKPA